MHVYLWFVSALIASRFAITVDPGDCKRYYNGSRFLGIFSAERSRKILTL